MASNIRDLARQTGLSTATVSLALRGAGRLSDATRARVLAAAKKAGYQPSPLVAKAMSLVRQPQEQRYRETLGFIMEYPLKGGPHFQRKIYDACVERAHASGFKLEPFVMLHKPAEHRQLSRVLHARGIRGLVIMPRLDHQMPRMFLQWEHFAAVEIGKTLWNPRNLHRTERPVYYELLEAFHLLKRVGYRRVGLAVEPMEDSHRRGIYTAAFLLWQHQKTGRHTIPPFGSADSWNAESFATWYETHRPDVIVIHDTTIVPSWLRAMNVRIPEDVSVFSSNVTTTRFSGLRADLAGLGSGAVEVLSLLLERNELGLSPRPRAWQVADLWQAGETLSRPITDYILEDGTFILGRFAQRNTKAAHQVTDG